MQAFEIGELLAEQKEAGNLYHEFLKVPSLSMGVYVLPAESVDPQSPHDEDEVYYVVSGRGMIRVDGEDRAVQAGSIVFVATHIEHKFHSIEEDLQILVFFAPAEGSSASA